MAEKDCLLTEVQNLNAENTEAKWLEVSLREEVAALKSELTQTQDALRDASLKIHQQVRGGRASMEQNI